MGCSYGMSIDVCAMLIKMYLRRGTWRRRETCSCDKCAIHVGLCVATYGKQVLELLGPRPFEMNDQYKEYVNTSQQWDDKAKSAGDEAAGNDKTVRLVCLHMRDAVSTHHSGTLQIPLVGGGVLPWRSSSTSFVYDSSHLILSAKISSSSEKDGLVGCRIAPSPAWFAVILMLISSAFGLTVCRRSRKSSRQLLRRLRRLLKFEDFVV